MRGQHDRENDGRRLSGLRGLAAACVIAGAVLSLALMYRAGRSQRSVVLILLFTGWVLSPFLGLLTAGAVAMRRPVSAQRAVALTTLAIAVVSVLAYAGYLPMPAGVKPAAVYLVVPLVSWIVIGAVFLIAR